MKHGLDRAVEQEGGTAAFEEGQQGPGFHRWDSSEMGRGLKQRVSDLLGGPVVERLGAPDAGAWSLVRELDPSCCN